MILQEKFTSSALVTIHIVLTTNKHISSKKTKQNITVAL